MTRSITFTVDLEDHLEVYAPSGRWVRNAQTLLRFCAERNIRATFFTVGRVALAAPQLLRDIHAGGHEIALHSHDHIPLTREDPEHYAEKLMAAKMRFEDITGRAVTGFRAPVFSLTRASAWVLEILAAQGFTYSSSIIAGRGAVHGFIGAPATPFLWPCGVVELPVPVLRLGAASLPFLGGVYLRYLPLALVRLLAAAQPQDNVLWTYTHPYDIDVAEGYVRMPDVPLWMNILLMHHRGGFMKKLGKLLDGAAAPPLAERVADAVFRARLASVRRP